MAEKTKAVLSWESQNDGLFFSCSVGTEGLPSEEWARDPAESECGRSCNTGIIIRLIEDELAVEQAGNRVLVPHLEIARLSSGETQALGLPGQIAFVLEIEAPAIITNPDFRFVYHLWPINGGPAFRYRREGSLITVGVDKYLVSEPYFTLLEDMDAFNVHPVKSTDRKMAVWAKLQALLPEDARVEDYLKRMTIALASSFTIKPFLNAGGEPDFDPIPGHMISDTDPVLQGPEELRHFEEVLPEARCEEFTKTFRRYPNSKTNYAVGAGTFLVLSEPVKSALEVVRNIQSKPSQERRAFLENPHFVLREQLAEELGEEVLDTIFNDIGYSERVKGIGI